MSDITSLLIWLTEKQFSNIVFGYEKGYHYFIEFFCWGSKSDILHVLKI